ncbi:MAG: cobalamin biosynthesis protein CobD [Desulfobacterales bacterium]|nr:MAG: cobalamin biosynthesis protein CobD [Desulfobacterales bacterium]
MGRFVIAQYPIWLILPAAFALDLILGDSQSLPHPVRWMGIAIAKLEPYFRKISSNLAFAGLVFAAALIIGTWVLTYLVVALSAAIHPWLSYGIEIIIIYFCIAARSLEEAAIEIRDCLVQNRVNDARHKVALVVGRDVAQYDAGGIARAVVETVAENLVDGVTAPLLFAAIGGAPLAMAYKMTNTLDSMVGYKNEAYLRFGKASARIDDILNYVPARLSVFVISLASQILSGWGKRSLKTALTEGAHHSSPNAGFPEAAFAGALAVKLNGPNYYQGKLVNKPFIGVHFGQTRPAHIKKACDIMLLSSFLWLVLLIGTGILFELVA